MPSVTLDERTHRRKALIGGAAARANQLNKGLSFKKGAFHRPYFAGAAVKHIKNTRRSYGKPRNGIAGYVI